MVPKARYMLDFRLMPEAVENQGETFIKSCLKGGGEFMAFLYNNYFHNLCKDTSVSYTAGDFGISENRMSPREYILYIDLPREHYDSTVYCTAYAIAYQKSMLGKISYARFYTVEASVFGTGCIGTMQGGTHVNYGDAHPEAGENIRAIYKLYRKTISGENG